MILNTPQNFDQSPMPSQQQRAAGDRAGVDITVPSSTWRMLANRMPPNELPKGLDAWFDTSRGFLKRLMWRRDYFLKQAARVLAFDAHYRQLSESKLREEVREFRELFRTGRDKKDDLLRAMALIREVSGRLRGEWHYHVQIAGGLALIHGCVAEMATGEGKTLTATLAATVAGWRGRGCHVITVNDYLARRDAETMRPIYEFCGLTVGYLLGEMKPPERRAAYYCDITYGTNKEICADFLRDRLMLGHTKNLPGALLGKIVHGTGTDRLVQRGLEFAIVDEADSVLIDEAVTPLIISGDAPNQEQVEAFKQAAEAAVYLMPQRHYTVNQRYREIELTDEGFEKATELTQSYGGLWHGARRREELIVQALTAREFYLKGKQYVVSKDDKGDKIVIVDEFTGRLMPDRTWRDGLHQAIEAKEKINVNPPKDTYARISFQRFFRTYKKLSGMTGTAREATRELWLIYHLPVVLIPTNRTCVRQIRPEQVFASEDAKWLAVVDEIKTVHATGQPILVGTRSVKNSERLSEMLLAEGLPHVVLNAVRHAEEAQIVAGAGGQGRITVATNMAGRGTDIKLAKGVADKGGLYVIATERHESGRVDRQLIGRAARQGDPGAARVFVSLEDELVTRYTPKLSALLRQRHAKARGPVTSRAAKALFMRAQRKAQRLALEQRKGVVRNDDWLDESLGFAGSET